MEKGNLYWVDGRYDLALETVEKFYDQNKNITGGRLLYTTMLVYNRRPDDASRVAAALEKDLPGSYFARSARFLIDAYEGGKANVEKIMTPDFVTATEQDFQYSLVTAVGYSMLGEKDEALYWLENAINKGFNNYIYMSEHDPFLENLREEERFKELMRRAKAKCDQFEAPE